MELMTLGELARATGRHKTTLKRYHERGEIPHPEHPDLGDGTGKVYGQAAIDFVATLRKNKPRSQAQEESEPELTAMDKRINEVLEGAMRAASGAAVTFLRHEIESARAGKEWEYESRLHTEMARLLMELSEDAPTPEPEVSE